MAAPFAVAVCPAGPSPVEHLLAAPSAVVANGAVAVAGTILAVGTMLWRHGLRDIRRIGWVPEELRQVTNFFWWALFFAAAAAEAGLTAAVLVAAGPAPPRVRAAMVLVTRVAAGAATVVLTLAINHHRLYRYGDPRAARAAAGPELRRQVRRLNAVAAGLFAAFIAADFVATNVAIGRGDTADPAATGDGPLSARLRFWALVGVLGVLVLPAVLGAVWIAVHDAPGRPSAAARGALLLGTVLWAVSLVPAAVWDDHVVVPGGCVVGGVASASDALGPGAALLALLAAALVVQLEYRRATHHSLTWLAAEIIPASADGDSYLHASRDSLLSYNSHTQTLQYE